MSSDISTFAVSLTAVSGLVAVVQVWQLARRTRILRATTDHLLAQLASDASGAPNPRGQDKVEYYYVVGTAPDGDRLTERHRMHITDPSGLPYWMTYVFCDDPEVAKALKIEDIRVSNGLEGAIPVILPASDPRRTNVALTFDPPLHGTVEWEITFSVPGFWTPLRTRGYDSIFVDVEAGRFSEILLTISSQSRSLKGEGAVADHIQDGGHPSVNSGGSRVVWRISEPPLGRHEFSVSEETVHVTQ